MVEHISSVDFNEYIAKGVTLVDFYATWCMPCKMLAPRVENVSNEMQDVAKFAKVDTDEAMDLAMRFGINAIPALYLFKDGELVDKSVGLISEDEIKNLIRKNI